jgi:hypothetical protein
MVLIGLLLNFPFRRLFQNWLKPPPPPPEGVLDDDRLPPAA